jgi:hypothetical protein
MAKDFNILILYKITFYDIDLDITVGEVAPFRPDGRGSPVRKTAVC